MKPSAFRALIIVIIIPVFAYFVLRHFADKALVMPPRYYYDTVLVRTDKGKKEQDTIWHKVKNFRLVNQLGDTVSWESMKGKIVLLNFFFTSCRSFCPRLSTNMYILQQALLKKPGMVQLLSFSVDSEVDSVSVLKHYADRYNVRHDIWWLLTGSQKTIYDLAQEEFHVGISEGVKDDFVHTDKFILLDRKRVVRGYYSGQDTAMIPQLLSDITLLYLEKQNK